MVLAPLLNKSASSVAHALVSHLLCPYTTPSVLLSDNGLEFKNEIIKSICQQYKITQTFITAYHPASSGLVERTNRKILDILRHVAGEFHEFWQDWLPQVAACINGSLNTSTGQTPHYIVYGHEKRLPYDIIAQPRVPVYNVDDYARNQLRALQIIHESVRRNLQASRYEMTQKQHTKATPLSLDVHDVVFKAAPDRQSKLAPKFSGPFIISEKLHGNKFKIHDPFLNKSEIVHADRLKRSTMLVRSDKASFQLPISTPPLTNYN